MFASFKLNTLKCKSGKTSDCDREYQEYNETEERNDHTYEKLPISKDRGSGRDKKIVYAKPPKTPRTPLTARAKKNKLVQEPAQVRSKIARVNIERENGSLGISLRGGYHPNPELSRALVITYIKPDGPTSKEGTIKIGDRLLAVDGISLHTTTLSDAQTLLKQQSTTTTLTIEYDVSILEAVENANGPLLIEIEQPRPQELGLTFYQNDDGIIIERIKPGSFADRCGALHVKDEILAINDTRLDNTSMSVNDVVRLLKSGGPVLKFEILPSNAVTSYSNFDTWNKKGQSLLSPSSSLSALSTLKSHSSRKPRPQYCEPEVQYSSHHETIYQNAVNISPLGFYVNHLGLTHSETLHTTLTKEDGSFGLEFMDSNTGDIIISKIIAGGPAERSGCLQPGDKILSINHRNVALDNLTANDLNRIVGNFKTNMDEGQEASISKLSLHIEFSVLESVVPASGIFIVKLARRGNSALGITISASNTSGFLICEMKKGSVAHRAGSLMPGDKLLSINNVQLDQCSLENAAHILHHSSDIVTLKVQRNEAYSEMAMNRSVVYTVELQRYGGPLGITIAGSEESFQPITVSGLTPGGLAEHTGALHIGDEILAINGHSLHGEPLSRAHTLLQSSSDLVTLKISRLVAPNGRVTNNRSPVLPPSVDSAVESWDSSRLDHTPSPEEVRLPQETEDVYKSRQLHLTSRPSHPNTNLSVEDKEIKDKEKSPNLAIFDEITNENLKIKQELDILSNRLQEQLSNKPKIYYDHTYDCNPNVDKSTFGEILKLKPNTNNCYINTKSKSSLETFKQNNAALHCDSVNTDNVRKASENTEDKVGDSNYGNSLTVIHEPQSSENDTIQNSENIRESINTEDYTHFSSQIADMPSTSQWLTTQHYLVNGCNEEQSRREFSTSQLHRVTLFKDPIYEDFGFSVSDGLYEKGVYINRIRKGGPADLSNILKPFDRILQVNETLTQDFDCCLTVPLIASAEEKLTLLVARNTASDNVIMTMENDLSPASRVETRDTCRETNQRILV